MQNQIGNRVGFIDKRSVSKAGSNAVSIGTSANYSDVNAMKTRLAAIDGAYYTTARLNQMSENDMVYAIRQADDAASV
jgi:hypothetical protein